MTLAASLLLMVGYGIFDSLLCRAANRKFDDFPK